MKVLDCAADRSLVGHLRAQTRADHEAVDAEFSGFDLSTRDGYIHFLMAHARVLPVVEQSLSPGSLIPQWQGRTTALLADIRALNGVAPENVSVDLPKTEAGRWGALYVLEGSRLGGAVLAKRIPRGMPSAYLSARHPPGAWTRILQTLDGIDSGTEFRTDAVLGAKTVFRAFLTAAAAQQRSPRSMATHSQ